ncbi:MAG: lipid A deacylase LpxR family protein [Janthinobacterium lividum]
MTLDPVVRSVAGAAMIFGAFTIAMPGPAQADAGRITVIEDNDGLLPDGRDRHYTQGAMLSYLSPKLDSRDFATALYDAVPNQFPFMQMNPDSQRKFDLVVGQSFFTPVKYHDVVPDPEDRPFAGFLYGGGSLLEETGGRMLENLEILVGVVGPDALARQTQELFHAATGFNNGNLDQSWSHQLKNEPGIMVSYDRHWKVLQFSVAGFEVDAIPDAGVTVGNVMTYAEIGGQLRIGQNLGADYGIPRIRPALSGTNWFDVAAMSSRLGWYLFAGVQGRAVAHNIFLDGSSFQDSPSVKKNILVGDFSTGASLFWSDYVKLDLSFTDRSEEFTTQRQADHFGNANLSFRF